MGLLSSPSPRKTEQEGVWPDSIHESKRFGPETLLAAGTRTTQNENELTYFSNCTEIKSSVSCIPIKWKDKQFGLC